MLERNIHMPYETCSKICGSFDCVSYMLRITGWCLDWGSIYHYFHPRAMCNYIRLSVVVATSAHMIQTMCQQVMMYCVSMYVLSNDRLGRCKANVCQVFPVIETPLAHKAVASTVLTFS
jgi:hypothetical protein